MYFVSLPLNVESVQLYIRLIHGPFHETHVRLKRRDINEGFVAGLMNAHAWVKIPRNRKCTNAFLNLMFSIKVHDQIKILKLGKEISVEIKLLVTAET